MVGRNGAETILELREASAERNGESLLKVFERLPLGDHVVFRTSAPPQALRERLQQRYEACYEWWPLEEGPSEWRILLVRRAREAPSPRPFLNLLDRDYVRALDQIRAVQAVLDEGRDRDAARRCGHLAALMRRHVRVCRELILPEAARHLGGLAGRLTELEELQETLDGVLDQLNAASAELMAPPGASRQTVSALVRVLRALLSAHAVHEERYLCPVLEHLLTESERGALVERCLAFV